MKRFVVAWLSFFDNEIEMEIVNAETAVEAIKKSRFIQGYELPENATIEDINYMLSGCDMTMSAIEI